MAAQFVFCFVLFCLHDANFHLIIELNLNMYTRFCNIALRLPCLQHVADLHRTCSHANSQPTLLCLNVPFHCYLVHTHCLFSSYNKTLHVSDSSSVYHQQFFTVHIAIHTGYADCLLASCQQTCMTYNIAVCTVKNCWWWTEELSEICSFIPKINLRN